MPLLQGLCAVFLMEMRRTFTSGDLNCLANLCYNCSACYYDCQFSRRTSSTSMSSRAGGGAVGIYQAYAWPRAFAGHSSATGLTISIVTALCVAAFILGFMAFQDPSVLRDPGTRRLL